eukprot:g2079.t1
MRKELEEMKVRLADAQQKNKKAQSQLRNLERERRAQVERKDKQLQRVQTQLTQQQQLRADEGAKFREANVRLKGKDQELKAALADRDRFRAVVEDRDAARLLAGGINIQAACPTLPEIEAHIRRTLTVMVSEWIEELPPARSAGLWLPWVLSHVFLECQELVEGIVRKHAEFMVGGFGGQDTMSRVDEATADLFRHHIRRHHRTLFPLAGERLQSVCTRVTSKLGGDLEYGVPDSSPGEVREKLTMKLERVVAEYLHILVGASLQHPAAIFSDDCGTMQDFDAMIHVESIDGDALGTGEACMVVFPALLVKCENGTGFQPASKPYILPAGRLP